MMANNVEHIIVKWCSSNAPCLAPTGFYNIPGYSWTSPGCFLGNNINQYQGTASPKECGIKCTNWGSDCVGFEFYNNNDGGATNNRKGDCVLSSSADQTVCDDQY